MTHAPRRPASSDLPMIVALVSTFLTTRILIVASLRLEQVAFVANDVSYYGYYLWKLLEQGDTSVMVEYPVPAVWILQGLYTLGGGWQTWTPVYAVFFLLLDAVVAVTFYRRGNAGGAWFWILFTGAQGGILWYRFDLIPAALVAWACLLVARRPAVAGGLVGLGAAIKLWPALLIGPMLAPDPRRGSARRRLVGFLVVGGALAAASLITSGWARSASPITWQSERGLQIESVPAMPLMILRTFTDNPSWNVFLSDYNALELEGPGVGLMLKVATALTAATILATVLLTVRLVRNLRRAPQAVVVEAVLLAVLTVVLATVISNKTLSPQYICWLGGPVAALLVLRTSGWLRRHVLVLAVSFVLVGALTQFTYPWGAYGIMAIPLGSGPETSVLVLRNLALISLTAYTAGLTWRASRSHAPDPSDCG